MKKSFIILLLLTQCIIFAQNKKTYSTKTYTSLVVGVSQMMVIAIMSLMKILWVIIFIYALIQQMVN